MRVHWIAIVLVALAAGAPGRALGGARPAAETRVLVMPFAVDVDAKTAGPAAASRWLGEAARLLLIDDLGRMGVSVVSRDECGAAFDRLQLPMAASLTRATMIRVGELVGASQVIFGDVHLADQLTVRTRMLHVMAGSAAPDMTERAALSDLFALFERTAAGLAPAIGQTQPARLHADPNMPFDVFENYVKGLVAPTPGAQQRFLETALKQAPHDARLLVALWGVYSSQGQPEKALAVASAVPRDSSLSRKARFSAALSLVDLGRFDGAAEQLTALTRERSSPILLNALGVVELRRPPGAASSATPQSYFKQAVDAEPGNTDYLFNLGYATARAQETDAALTFLREAVRYDAANGDAHLVMSAVLSGQGKSVEGQRELDLAKQLGTRPDTSLLTLSAKIPNGLERLPTDLDVPPSQRLDATIANPAQRDQQETAAFHFDQGRTLFDAQRDREATNELRRAIYLAPYENPPHVLLGRVYQRGGRVNEAIDEFKVAIWCRETAEARAALAGALLDSGDKDAARREAERALALDPNSAEAKALLKRIGATIW
ncbi:MAG: tetratricopeptide repeat protein [Vicinamibacterales bacterium]